MTTYNCYSDLSLILKRRALNTLNNESQKRLLSKFYMEIILYFCNYREMDSRVINLQIVSLKQLSECGVAYLSKLHIFVFHIS